MFFFIYFYFYTHANTCQVEVLDRLKWVPGLFFEFFCGTLEPRTRVHFVYKNAEYGFAIDNADPQPCYKVSFFLVMFPKLQPKLYERQS